MNETIQSLLSQMNGKSKYFTEAEMAEIFKQARQEAIIEVKALLREHMVSVILEKIINREALDEDLTVSPPDQSLQDTSQSDRNNLLTEISASSTASQTQSNVSDEEDSTLAEIDMLRKQISENEELLKQIKTPPSETIEPLTETDEAAGSGYYVFGVIRDDLSVSELLEGVDHLGYPVFGLNHKNIQAVVCEVPLSEFGEEPLKTNVENTAWLEDGVRSHQSILEALSSSATVIPMKFCTIYLSENRVLEVLTEYHDSFLENLQSLSGKKEWGVKVYYNQKVLSEVVSQTNLRVQEFQEDIDNKTEGLAYFARKKLEVAISEEVERGSDNICQTCHDHLSSVAKKSSITPLHSKETTGRTDEMALNGAYLVDDQDLDTFRAELASLKDIYTQSGFNFELSGPWPPYNFVTIDSEATPTNE